MDSSEASRYMLKLNFELPRIFDLKEADKCYCLQSKLPRPHPIHVFEPLEMTAHQNHEYILKQFRHKFIIQTFFFGKDDIVLWRTPFPAIGYNNINPTDFTGQINNKKITGVCYCLLFNLYHIHFSSISRAQDKFHSPESTVMNPMIKMDGNSWAYRSTKI